MHSDRTLVEGRIARILTERILPAIHTKTVPLTLRRWEVPDEPVPAAEALAQTYTDFAVKTPWGRPWSTSWFELRGTVPAEWAGERVELLIDPGFVGDWPGGQAEGLVFTPDGVPLKGINPRNRSVPIVNPAVGGEEIHLYVEIASNPDVLAKGFLPTTLGDKATSGDEPLYTFDRADVVVLNHDVWHLYFDVEVLNHLMLELGVDDPRRYEILNALENAVDALDLGDLVGSAAAARAELTEVLAAPARRNAHTLHGIGHAHIDSAWLWPVRETIRKTGRTFANVTHLATEYPETVFACSQAQQYAWVKEHQPAVFDRIKTAIKNGNWIPVGGMWVESDSNLPGGEALARQLVHGTRLFRDELDWTPDGVWLPDSFGYNGSFPQIARLAGMEWFLTQKISWNQVNKFPHHTFWWEGIDGTRIFTHFPPVDTYNSTLEGNELAHATRNYRDIGGGQRSLVPFGYGDGGGGPTRDMMERARRTRDLEGSPKVVVENPSTFFAKAQQEYADAPVWTGELYLELHRATFTTQARTKSGNRRSEHLLREAELTAVIAALAVGASYPYEHLDALWKTTLLQQFHDILPGSSIAWVHAEAEANYARIAAETTEMIEKSVRTAASDAVVVVNAAPHARTGVVATTEGLALVETPANGLAPLIAIAATHPVQASDRTLENGLVRVTLDDRGLITSILDLTADREVVPTGQAANLLQLHPDLPNAWDAWDIDQHYRNRHVDLVDLDSITLVESDALRSTIEIVRTFGASTITQRVSLSADSPRVEIASEIDWHESEKILKAAFPVAVHAAHHSAEIQFGHVRRPTHSNTSWESARFEVYAHRWLHVGEPDWGVAVVNDSTYGHDVTKSHSESGQNVTTVRLSVVRAPHSPDPHADQGAHSLVYAIVPGATIDDAAQHGYELNLPLRVVGSETGGLASALSLVAASSADVHVEAVKLADDRSGDVIVRLYEGGGVRARTTLTTGFSYDAAVEQDLHEQDAPRLERLGTLTPRGRELDLTLEPFQIVTLRFTHPRLAD